MLADVSWQVSVGLGGSSRVAYGKDRDKLAQSTNFGTDTLKHHTIYLRGGYPILKVKVKVKSRSKFR